jgi:hypothetical protein
VQVLRFDQVPAWQRPLPVQQDQDRQPEAAPVLVMRSQMQQVPASRCDQAAGPAMRWPRARVLVPLSALALAMLTLLQMRTAQAPRPAAGAAMLTLSRMLSALVRSFAAGQDQRMRLLTRQDRARRSGPAQGPGMQSRRLTVRDRRLEVGQARVTRSRMVWAQARHRPQSPAAAGSGMQSRMEPGRDTRFGAGLVLLTQLPMGWGLVRQSDQAAGSAMPLRMGSGRAKLLRIPSSSSSVDSQRPCNHLDASPRRCNRPAASQQPCSLPEGSRLPCNLPDFPHPHYSPISSDSPKNV